MPPKSQRKRIGPYRLLNELGQGGMGIVWHAMHEVLQRDVAIKELLAKTAKDKEAVERFRREGLALAQLKHESIVGVHDLFVAADRLYMVLEYVDGVPLHVLVKEAPLPWDVAAIVGTRVASALEHAHHRKVIHRDVKPANVMLSKTGEVKLMDFGIARDQLLENLTRTGFAVGTPSYMAPEVLTGQKGDSQSDIFSLGVMLYEAVVGVRPFDKAEPAKTFAAIVSGRFVPLKHMAPKVPRTLRRIIERCLDRDPKRRFRTAADLRLALELFLADQGARANHRSRVVGFLKARKKISETEALTCLNAAELMETAFADVAIARRGRWAMVAATGVALLLVAAALLATQRPAWFATLLGSGP